DLVGVIHRPPRDLAGKNVEVCGAPYAQLVGGLARRPALEIDHDRTVVEFCRWRADQRDGKRREGCERPRLISVSDWHVAHAAATTAVPIIEYAEEVASILIEDFVRLIDQQRWLMGLD